MKPQDHYLKFVRWSAEDEKYIGYCPDLFPWGGVCHADDEQESYRELCVLVSEELDDLRASGRPLPEPQTRAMRDALSV